MSNKSTYRLQSFKIKTYSKVKLDFKPKEIQFYDPFFIMNYDQSSQDQIIPYIDIFDKSGEPVRRINILKILKQQNLSLQSIGKVKIPKLDWSSRQHLDKFLASRGNKHEDRNMNQDQNKSWKSDSDTEEDLPGIQASKTNSFKPAKDEMSLYRRGLLSKLIITGECFLGLEQDLPLPPGVSSNSPKI